LSSEQDRLEKKAVVVQIRTERDQIGASQGQSFIALLQIIVLIMVVKGTINISNHPIETQLFLVTPINM
jgi:hypothetical protein